MGVLYLRACMVLWRSYTFVLASVFFLYVWLRLPFLLLSDFCSFQRSACAICRSCSPWHLLKFPVLSAWSLERIGCECFAGSNLSTPTTPDPLWKQGVSSPSPRWRRTRPRVLVASRHPNQKTSTSMEVEMHSDDATR